MKRPNGPSQRVELRKLRDAYIDQVCEVARLAGIEPPPREAFRRDTPNPTYRPWANARQTNCSVDWADPALGFERAVAHLGCRPKDHELARVDTTKPWSLGNARWVWRLPRWTIGRPPKVIIDTCKQFAASEAKRLGVDIQLYRRTGSNWLYRTWKGMRQRCDDPCNQRYECYGGRDISLHEDWSYGDTLGFEMFASWIIENLGERPEGCTLDRIDNDGNYAPGNLRWATNAEQRANTRKAALAHERRIKAAEMLEAGATVAQIASTLECSVGTVSRMIRQLRTPNAAAVAVAVQP